LPRSVSVATKEFEIHTKIDRNGFVGLSLDASKTPEIPWEESFRDVDVQERYKHLNLDDYELDHTYELECQCEFPIKRRARGDVELTVST
jgi:hypothetical protein